MPRRSHFVWRAKIFLRDRFSILNFQFSIFGRRTAHSQSAMSGARCYLSEPGHTINCPPKNGESSTMFSAIGRATFYRLFQLPFQRLELFRLRALFVERVERVTARDQAVARPGGAIAESAAQPLGS